MSETIMIAGRAIGRSHQPFIIAEMSGNHNQSLDRALAIVDAAAQSRRACAEAADLYRRHDDARTSAATSSSSTIPNSLWKGRSLHKLYQEAHTPWEWHAPDLRARAVARHDSVFDAVRCDGRRFSRGARMCPATRSRRSRTRDLPLIRKVAATGKPMIISTGMATVADIDEAVRCAREAGCRDLVLLKCTSTYPAAPSDTNLTDHPAYACSCSGARSGCPTTRLASGSRWRASRSAPA